MPAVCESALVPASAARVWEAVRDFNGLPAWHPLVVESRIEEARPADQIGCVRNFRLKDGGVVRERLLGLCDHSRTCRYAILDSPMPVTDYVAAIRLLPVTETGQCYVEWSADFGCPAAERAALTASIGAEIFGGGLQGLREHFGAA